MEPSQASSLAPPLFDSVELLGKDRTRARMLQAIEFLGGISNKNLSALTKAWQKQAGSDLFTTAQQPQAAPHPGK